MTVNAITIPKSYLSYLGNPAVQSAVNDLLGKKPGNIPNDFDWRAIQQYHEALFSAHHVRRDYTMMLFALMTEVYLKPAEEKGLGKSAILPLNDWWEDTEPSPKNIWEDGLYCFLKCPRNNTGQLGFYIAIEEDERLLIEIYIAPLKEKEKYFDDEWTYDKATEWWKFNGDANLMSMKGKSEISVGVLRDVVKRALDKILADCG